MIGDQRKAGDSARGEISSGSECIDPDSIENAADQIADQIQAEIAQAPLLEKTGKMESFCCHRRKFLSINR